MLELRYKAFDGPSELTGSGRTIDVSSSGLSFTADKPLPLGLMLDVSVDWPVLLTGAVQLQLVLSGEVIRSDGNATALRVYTNFVDHPS